MQSTPDEPIRASVEGALRYMHSYEFHSICKTDQTIARMSGAISPGHEAGALTQLDHHIQAAYLYRILRRYMPSEHWIIMRAYYLPLTEHGTPQKEIACAKLAEMLLEYLDEPGLNHDWVWDTVRGWAGLPKWRTHAEWARYLMQGRTTVWRHRYGSAQIEGIEEVLEDWRGQARGKAAIPLREFGLVAEPKEAPPLFKGPGNTRG